MRKAIFFGLLIPVILISCGKNGINNGAPLNHSGDNTGPWIGTYTGAVGGTNTINRIIVAKVNDSVVQMQLQTNYQGIYFTYVTLQNVMLTTTTTASVNENGVIASYTDIYHFAGSASLSGNNLTVSGNATSTTHPSDIKPYYFSGSK